MRPNRLASLACRVLACAAFALAACHAAPATTCSPSCAAGTHCDATSLACVQDAVDAAADDGAGGCTPACAAPTPRCSAAHTCVACLVDGDCPLGSICSTSALGAECVPGCHDDSRCATGTSCCGGACTDLTADAANCGACGTGCPASHASAACVASVCTLGACDEGFGDCDHDPKNGCETNLHVDPANCTACGAACAIANAIAGCSDGCYARACDFGYDDCDGNAANGCETSVESDPKNCGACGAPCQDPPHATSACVSASCIVTSCQPGYADCNGNGADGCETAIGTDAANCGACGVACMNGLVCQNGSCTCPQCNIPNARTACVNNQCVLASCLDGYADCDKSAANGCEVYLLGDGNNCTACGLACPMANPYCVAGQCTTINTKTLLVTAAQMAYVADVKAKLAAFGDLAAVDVFDATTATPTLAQLMPYGAVLVFSDSGFSDAATLGNNLADYFDQGGQVIIASFANASVPVTGRFGAVANGYMLVQPAGQEEPMDSLGTIAEPQSPLVAGVAQLTCSSCFRSSGSAINGGVVVASWQSGRPLVVRGVVKGRNRADLNFYPPSSTARQDFWSGDGARLLHNAVLYR